MALDYYIQKIQEKRKQTPFREFIREIVSWKPIVLHRNMLFISRFPVSDRVTVVDRKIFESNQSNMDDVLRDNDSLSFFDSLSTVFRKTPLPPTIHFFENENSEYADIAVGCKTAYLSFAVVRSENVFYSESVKDNSNYVFNSLVVLDNSENIYMAKNIFQSFQIFYSKNILNSRDIRFSSNLQNCQECLLCDGLEGQSYCINNVQLSKESYVEQKKKMLFDKENFDKYYTSLSYEEKNRGSEDVFGKGIILSENVKNGHMTYRIHNGRNVVIAGTEEGNSNFFDVFGAGAPSGDDFYAVIGAGTGAQGVYCSSHINGGTNIFYSYYCQNCSHILGCIGLQNKEFCLFNKQYTKEERHQKVEEIFAQMDKEGTLGDFFPGSMNPFYFNDTVAYLLDPSITKEEVTKLGYLRRDDTVKVDIPSNMEIVRTSELGNFEGFISSSGANAKDLSDRKDSSVATLSQNDGAKRHIDPSILDKIIIDDQGNYYRIVKMEYDFLAKYHLPLPRKHWLDRLKMHFDLGLGLGN